MRRTAIVTLLIARRWRAGARRLRRRRQQPSCGEAQTFDPNKQVDADDLERLHRPRARPSQRDHRRVREAEPERHRRQRRQRQRRQDRRRAARRQRARRDALVQHRQHRRLLLLGRLDRPRRPYIERDNVDDRRVPAGGPGLHRVPGHALRDAAARRRLRPLLQPVDMFEAAGDQVAAEDDLRARRRREEAHPARLGRLDRGRRLRPDTGFYESVPAHYGPQWDAQWQNADGKSSLATDPGWTDYLEWDKNLIDWYGYDELTKFLAGAGAEFSASNAFETGKVAMMLDGEYRTAFIADEHPELNYGTAPFPVADGQEDRYGAGYVTGSIIGIPRDSENQAAAWELVKYLTTDTDALGDPGQRARQRADDARRGGVAEAGPRATVRPVHPDLQEPRTRRPPRSPPPAAPTRSCSSRSSPSTRRARSTTCRPDSRISTPRSTPRRRTPPAAERGAVSRGRFG